MNISIELDIPPGLRDIGPTGVLVNWHLHAHELADMEQQSVAERTPVLTGALRDSTAALANLSAEELAEVYYDDTLQLETWHRVYAEYQEGPPLGKPTYTNGPRQMLERAESEDVEQIRAWAERYAQSWADDLVAFAGGEV